MGCGGWEGWDVGWDGGCGWGLWDDGCDDGVGGYGGCDVVGFVFVGGNDGCVKGEVVVFCEKGCCGGGGGCFGFMVCCEFDWGIMMEDFLNFFGLFCWLF